MLTLSCRVNNTNRLPEWRVRSSLQLKGQRKLSPRPDTLRACVHQIGLKGPAGQVSHEHLPAGSGLHHEAGRECVTDTG